MLGRANELETMLGHREGVRGILLAGSYHWGSSLFDRLLRGPMVPVALEPLISYPLRWLNEGGIPSVTICANSATPEVRGFLGRGDALAMNIEYYEDHAPRGAAGCVRDAASRSDARTVVVVEGGLIPFVSLDAVLETHFRAGAVATVVVETDRRRNAMTGERPSTPGGIYVFDRRALAAVSPTGFQDIKESLLERLYRAGERVVAHSVAGVAPRVNNYETYVSVNAWQVSEMISRRARLGEYVPAGEGMRHMTARVDPRAHVVGPVLIGPRAEISAGAVLVAPTVIGAESYVGYDATVSRSILWSGCKVSNGATLDRALLADHAIVQPGENFVGAMRLPDSDRGRWVAIPPTTPLRRDAGFVPRSVHQAPPPEVGSPRVDTPAIRDTPLEVDHIAAITI
jgi:mannose-1-phosphate guanylyltransferase